MDRHSAPEIQRLGDGSIDIEHYLRIAHQMRSDQAHRMVTQILPNANTVLGVRARLLDLFGRNPPHRTRQSV